MDDSGDTQGQRATIDPPPETDLQFDPFTKLTGLAPSPIEWVLGNGSAVTIMGGSGGNSFVIHGSIPNVALTIYAGSGNNLLIAGQTAVSLIGAAFNSNLLPGNNILIGGTTDYDYNSTAIDAIMTELGNATNATFDSIVSALQSGTNGLPALNANTVHDNGLASQLVGGANLDWFFATQRDILTNFITGDVFTIIS